MTLTEFRNKFLRLEEKYDFFSINQDGFAFWQYIRVRVYYALQDELFDFKKGENKWNRISLFSRMKSIFHSLLISITKNPLYNFKPKEILIFTGSRRIKKNGKDYDLYFDELINSNFRKFNVLEDYFQGNDYKTPEFRNIGYIDFLYIFQKLINLKYILIKAKTNEYDKVINIIESEFGVTINRRKLQKFYINYLIEHKYFRNIYKKIIKKASPKIILETVSYGTWKQIFNEEARKLKIPVAELQHGFMGQFQIPYNFENKRAIDSFPEYIFTFGDFWNNSTAFPIEDDRIISCGFPHFEEKVAEFKQSETNRYTVLFISQPTIAKGLINIALALSKLLSGKNIQIVYKLHPMEYAMTDEIYRQLRADKFITVADDNSEDLYQWFAKSNAQAGVYSTALIEGLGFNLETFIVKLYGHEWMSDLYNNSYAKLVDSAEEILETISSTHKKNNIPVNKFWKKDSMNNLINEIEKIIDKE